MKKNRSIPFGYKVENGIIIADKSETDAVQIIFNEYATGLSLSKLAQLMTNRKIPYHNNSSLWNKNMIKRILENEKYCGIGEYESIVSPELFKLVNSKKQAKISSVNPIAEALSGIRKRIFCLK